jgi:stringent starvation protein B
MRPLKREIPKSETLAIFASRTGKGVAVEPLCGVPRKIMPVTSLRMWP